MAVYHLGIDPGQSGGIAVVTLTWAAAVKMPATEKDILDEIRGWPADGTVAVIESVHAMPGQGVTSMFTFGQNYGALRMALTAAGIPWKAVTPQKWQKHFGLTGGKDDKTAKKNRHKAEAQRRFPKLKITHATADALLIALYAKETYV